MFIVQTRRKNNPQVNRYIQWEHYRDTVHTSPRKIQLIKFMQFQTCNLFLIQLFYS